MNGVFNRFYHFVSKSWLGSESLNEFHILPGEICMLPVLFLDKVHFCGSLEDLLFQSFDIKERQLHFWH